MGKLVVFGERVSRRIALLLPALTIAVCGSPAATQTFNQPFNSEGPAPSIGPTIPAVSRDIAPDNGSTSGAVNAVLPVPGDSNSMFLGAVNGGIWTTRDAGTTWQPLTDKQPSLSIATLAYNSTD